MIASKGSKNQFLSTEKSDERGDGKRAEYRCSEDSGGDKVRLGVIFHGDDGRKYGRRHAGFQYPSLQADLFHAECARDSPRNQRPCDEPDARSP